MCDGQIKGMDMKEEYVQLNAEKIVNLSMHGGVHPKVYRRSHPVRFTRLYYCYYKPEPGSCYPGDRAVILTAWWLHSFLHNY